MTRTVQQVRAAIVADALTWLGTPYRHLGDVKGQGVDCAMLLVRLLAAQQLIPQDLDPRPYSPQWHLHRGEERYLQWLQQLGTPTDDPQPGDIAVWRYGRTYSHGALYIGGGQVVHALAQARMVLRQRMHEQPLAGRVPLWFDLITPNLPQVS